METRTRIKDFTIQKYKRRKTKQNKTKKKKKKKKGYIVVVFESNIKTNLFIYEILRRSK